jgi:hypothetical protein
MVGFARQNNNNATTIPKPPTGQAADQGGTQYMVLEIPPYAGPTMIATNIALTHGGHLKFGHAIPTDQNDGRMGARLFNRGLNIIGSATEAGDTKRYIHLWGDTEPENGFDFVTLGDGYGLRTFGGGRFYKKSVTGIVIRCHSGNTQPKIENNDGSNVRDIIDTVNGDTCYALKSEVGAGVSPANTLHIAPADRLITAGVATFWSGNYSIPRGGNSIVLFNLALDLEPGGIGTSGPAPIIVRWDLNNDYYHSYHYKHDMFALECGFVSLSVPVLVTVNNPAFTLRANLRTAPNSTTRRCHISISDLGPR